MSYGQVQTVLVCLNSSQTDQFGLCPQGQSLGTIQAYVLDPSTQSTFEQNQTMDYSLMGQYFGFAFVSIIMFWALGKGLGSLLSVVR